MENPIRLVQVMALYVSVAKIKLKKKNMKKIRQTLKVHISIITGLMIKLKFGMD